MTKKEIQELLEARGIKYDPQNKKAVLEALLPKDVIKDAPAQDLEATEDSIEEDSIESSTDNVSEDLKNEVMVYNKYGIYIRTYSVVDHGENFRELAKQFSDKINK